MADTAAYHDRDGFIWYDGKLVPWREANLHVLSHGLHYASAVFEGERAYGGAIFELTQHSQRLSEGAKTMDFTIPYASHRSTRPAARSSRPTSSATATCGPSPGAAAR